MKQEDKELLEKYLAYRRKRNKIIIILIISTVVLVGAIYSYIYMTSNKNNNSNINMTTTQKDIKVDTEQPVITLKEKQISIFRNETIDYMQYISSATDNIDGNIIQNVKYNTINTNNIGEFEIIYSVEDNANNRGTEKLKVIIKEKENKPKVDTSSKDVSNTKKEDSTSNNSNSSNSTVTNSNRKNNKKTKDFLFKDGYDMNTVSKVASDYIDANGGRGEAYPIRDAEGIIIGMRVKIY